MKRPLDQLAEIAQKAVSIGNYLIKNTRPQAVTEKADRDTYTDVDVRIEHEVRTYLADATPEIGFIGEEEGRSGQARTSEHLWTLDPIDGTSNFVHGIPLCAVQLALIHRNEPLVAAISLPYMEMHYWAAHHLGAYANGNQIRTSTKSHLSESITSIGDYATGPKSGSKNKRRIALTAALAERVERIRMFGSAAHDLAWLAEGRTDAAIMLSNNSIDVAPGVLIAREAGALVVDSTGKPHSHESNEVIAANSQICGEIVNIIQSVNQSP